MKKLLFISVFAIVFTACVRDTAADSMATKTMTVGFASDTRVQLTDGCKTVWNKGDMVSVFNKNDVNSCWRYRGEDKANEGLISMVSSSAEPSKTFFDIYGIYPYNADYSVNEFGELLFTIPVEQSWCAGSYGIGDNIMVAIGEDDKLSFKNIFGYLKLQFKGTEEIKRIVFRGNDNETLTGAIAYDPFLMDGDFSEGVGNAIALNCSGVTLCADQVQEFYIAIIPQVFDKGFSIEIETVNGVLFKQKTQKLVEIKRNTIHPMAVVMTSEMECVRPVISYTASAKITPNRTDVFGANIVSHNWDSKTGVGEIEFDNMVTMIGDSAFYECSITSITIPNTVTEIGSTSFAYCRYLESMTIPENVTQIGSDAFRGSGVSVLYCKPIEPPAVSHWVYRDGSTAIQMYALPHSSKTKIYVPRESIANYTQYSTSSTGTSQENWSLYKNYIEPYDFEE